MINEDTTVITKTWADARLQVSCGGDREFNDDICCRVPNNVGVGGGGLGLSGYAQGVKDLPVLF